MRIIAQPMGGATVGGLLTSALNSHYSSFSLAVAFARLSGVRFLANPMRTFLQAGGSIRATVGIDQDGTTYEALSSLLEIISSNGELWVNHDEAASVTFHPKLYLFEGVDRHFLVIGSSNLTHQALTANDEAMFYGEIGDADAELLESARTALSYWRDPSSGTARRLDRDLLEALRVAHYVPLERDLTEQRRVFPGAAPAGGNAIAPLFGRRRRPTRRTRIAEVSEREAHHNRVFVMTLMRTDVGVGQTTPGTSRRSPEIFVPLTARDAEPGFWGWPDLFTEDPTKPGKYDRDQVSMRIGSDVIGVNMMTWPDKHDFRLRSEALRSAGQEGDLLRIEKTSGANEFKYYVEIIPRASQDYEYYLDFCTNQTPHSERLWGYV